MLSEEERIRRAMEICKQRQCSHCCLDEMEDKADLKE